MITMRSYLTDRAIYMLLFLLLVAGYKGIIWAAAQVGWGATIAGLLVFAVLLVLWVRSTGGKKDQGIYSNTDVYRYCHHCGTRMFQAGDRLICPECGHEL